jgi:alpha-L-fucosidase
VPYEIERRLIQMGDWLRVNGESIYGSQAFDLDREQHDWGKITCRQMEDGNTRLYLHLYNWPLNNSLPLTGILEKAQKAWLLADAAQTALPFMHSGAITQLELPEQAPDPYVSVVVLEYTDHPEVEDKLVAKSVYGGYALTPAKAMHAKGNTDIFPVSRRGTVPAHIEISEPSSYQWRIYLEQAASLLADISYHYEAEEGKTSLKVISEGGTLVSTAQLTGQTVGEPNSGWHIQNFLSHRMGTLTFPEAGYYTISLEIDPVKQGEISFQWLWLEEE